MASLIRQPTSKFWTAAFRDAHGKQIRRTTGETNKKRALVVAEQFERVAQGRGKPQRVRQALTEFYREHYGVELPFSNVRDFAERWLASRRMETSPATFGRYEHVVGKWLAFLGDAADHGLEEISKSQILAFRDAEIARSAVMTANTKLKIIKMIMRSARLEGYLLQDPAERVKTVKNRTEVSRRPFTISELRAVLGVADSEWTSLIKFGLYTGQRLGDLCLLIWTQIDLERDEIRLTTRKTGKSLLIPIAEPLREHILSLDSTNDPRAPVHPRAFEIVVGQNGRVGTLSNQFSDLLVAAGLRGPQPHRSRGIGRGGKRTELELSFHSLRHTAVSLLKDAGVPDSVVQALVGHESAAMSARYTHVGKEALAKAQRHCPNYEQSRCGLDFSCSPAPANFRCFPVGEPFAILRTG